MKIKVCEKNKNKIEALLEKTNGTASEHTICSYRAVQARAALLESDLERLGLPKKHRIGTCARIESGEKCATGYKYDRIGTEVHFIRGASDWFITDIKRSTLYPGEGGKSFLALKKTQDEYLVAALRKTYTIQKGVE